MGASPLVFENWNAFFVMLHTFMCDITYMPQKISQLGELKDQNMIIATVLTMKL